MSEIPMVPQSVMAEDNSSGENKSFFKKWSVLGVLTLGLAIVVIDTTLLNVSLSTIIKELHTDLQSLQWVITGYALVLAAFTITGGRFGDLFGRKRMFMLGAIIFAVGSFIASISHNIPTLLLGEAIIEGFGAALMMPATASLVVANFSGKDRATAFGIWGGVAGASSAIGPLLGGYLTSHYSWRWGFRINVFVAAVVIIGSLLLLKESRDERKPSLDWWGVLLSALGLLGITFGIIESSTLGWWHAKKAFELFHHSISFGSLSLVPISIILGALILALFFWWEQRVEKNGRSPLVSLKLLQNQQFTSGAVTTAILTLGMTGMVFALPVFLQTVKNLDAFNTGLALLPLSLALLVVAPITGVLSKKITPKHLIQTGLIIDIIAAFILRATIAVDMPISHLIFGLSLYGAGMGMVFAPISNLVLSAVPVEMSGEASGVNNTLRQVGATLGAAIIGAAVLASLSTHLVKGVADSQIIPASAKPQIIQTVSDPNSNVEFSVGSAIPSDAPPIVSQEIEKLVAESSARATQDAYIYSAFFAFLCFIAALFLPKTNVHDTEAPTEPEEEHGTRKLVTAAVLLAVGIFAALFLLRQSAGRAVATGLDTNAALVIPKEIGQVQGDNTFKAAVLQPRGSDAVDANPPISQPPKPTQLPPAVVYKTYANSALGFQMQISNLWQVTQAGNGHTVVFTNAQGQNISVQSYDVTNETLDTVEQQLRGSNSANNVTRVTFLNEAAISFHDSSANAQGVAVIHNNKLFYIMAPSLTQPPVNTFLFL